MDFTNPHFAEPNWLWLAALGPLVLFALQRYSAWSRTQQLAQLASPKFLSELTETHSPARRFIKEILLLLAVAVFGLALARPQWGQQELAGQMVGQDIIFILDSSRSMLAADVSPSRLQRAKISILDFVQRRGTGRVGLVAFAGQAFLQCPLTYDYGAFRDTLNAVDEKTIPVAGTDVGRALDEAFRAMKKSNGDKFAVLVTDGEDLEKGGVRVAESLAKEKVMVFTVGVGTPAGAEIQVINDQGRPELVRDSKGEVVRSRLDEPTLRSIAQATKGAYHHLGPVGEGLAKVQLGLEELKAASASTPGRTFGVDRFHFPVALALLLVTVESLIGTRRREKVERTGVA